MKLRKQRVSGVAGAEASKRIVQFSYAVEKRLEPRRPVLEDLSVDSDTEALLKRRRWRAVIQVGLPLGFEPSGEFGLVELIDNHLDGRNPLSGVYDQSFVTTFSVLSAGDDDREMVAAFALAMAHTVAGDTTDESRVIASGITFVDTSDIEHLLPDDRRQGEYTPGL